MLFSVDGSAIEHICIQIRSRFIGKRIGLMSPQRTRLHQVRIRLQILSQICNGTVMIRNQPAWRAARLLLCVSFIKSSNKQRTNRVLLCLGTEYYPNRVLLSLQTGYYPRVLQQVSERSYPLKHQRRCMHGFLIFKPCVHARPKAMQANICNLGLQVREYA